MAYRPTERTEARRTQTRERIVRAALALVAQGGYREAQVAAVAARAGVATGTVYRHFPSKADLLTEVFRVASSHEVEAVEQAARFGSAASQHEVDAVAQAGGDFARERIAAAVETFARRALQGRRLAWALLAEPVDPAVEAERLQFRRAYADVFARTIADGIASGELPEQDPAFTATALVGAIGEALVGPLSPTHAGTDVDALVRNLIIFSLRSTTDQELSPHVHRRAA
ncbi:MAG: TetR/AcrR family transcriptional regulator [Conexibacter sp.]|nr:TetR/AcrR family transcriptional regulator [Conexibacter sp.]